MQFVESFGTKFMIGKGYVEVTRFAKIISFLMTFETMMEFLNYVDIIRMNELCGNYITCLRLTLDRSCNNIE